MELRTKIAVGCGKRNYGPDWIHIDSDTSFKHIDGDNPYLIRRPSISTGSIDLIYASHLLAYWDREEVNSLLKSWYAVLKRGGKLRIATPDFDSMIALYVNGAIELKDINGPLYGKWKGVTPVGDYFEKKIYHKTVWNFTELNIALAKAGFKNIERYDWRSTEHAHIDDHSQAYLAPKGDKVIGTLISLNVECIRP